MEMEHLAPENLFLASVPRACNSFGDPEIPPRIGDQYQAVIPPLITESDAVVSWNNSRDSFIGLPLAITWMEVKFERTKDEAEEFPNDLDDNSDKSLIKDSGSVKKMRSFPKGKMKATVQPLDIEVDGRKELREYTKLFLREEMKNEMQQKQGGYDYYPVPCTLTRKWSGLEEASFLLGLYTFGKNLVLVKKFVESKAMGDVLSYYYGKFYGNDQYRRWSDSRKRKRRMFVCGQRIFTGSRQQELLARLLPHLSEECQSTLLEVNKKFGDGKLLLEDYIFFLKSAVGLNVLVDAVGIGKGKKDLTKIVLESSKNGRAIRAPPEVPTGKACSSLSHLEIVNFLTGGSRLSKARSNDLFWEAVWPRLLARGWHSEQPNDQSFVATSRNSLVFLVPGIKKFSRRKLVKGNHYYDSIADVLNKVASNPALLELDIEGYKCNNNEEENGWSETKSEEENSPSPENHCYLKPQIPSIEFTVVDTSMASREATGMIKTRSLPVEMVKFPSVGCDSEESVVDSFEEPEDRSVSVKKLCFDRKNNVLKSTKFPNGETMTGPSSGMHQREMIGRKGVRRPRERKVLAPVGRQKQSFCMEKRQRINEVPFCPKLDENESDYAACKTFLSEDIVSLVNPPEEKLQSTSSSRDSQTSSGECIGFTDYFVAEHPRTLIDLNIPIPQEVENEFSTTQPDQTNQQPVEGSPRKSTPVCDSSSERPPPNTNSRRHSVRNRPPTVKALEALACGFFGTKPKRKAKDEFLPRQSISKPIKQARRMRRMNENFGSFIVDFEGNERGNNAKYGDIEGETQL